MLKRKLIFVLLLFPFSCIHAQTYSETSAVELQAEIISTGSESIKLLWSDDLMATRWSVYKKNDEGEFDLLKVVFSPDTSFIDIDVDKGQSYTYMVHKEDVQAVLGFGIITAGIETKASINSGEILVLVHDSLYTPLQFEINQYLIDLQEEGWKTELRRISATASVTDVKKGIKDQYITSDSALTSVVIIGRIAVPYSGNLAPDGHNSLSSPKKNHKGAWPADCYYGDMDGIWTDTDINLSESPFRAKNNNIIGDGKMDQSYLPSDVELQIGRISLEGFSDYEEDIAVLYRRYFARNHAFRTHEFTYNTQSLIMDDFKARPESFAGIAHRSFGLFMPQDDILSSRLPSKTSTESFLLSYGCGPGDFDHCGRKLKDTSGNKLDCYSVSETREYMTEEVHVGINILFGSYFGDWDNKNNLLRAPLAGKSPALASFWAGRPVWHLDGLAHGQTLGEITRASQNADLPLFTFIERTNSYERSVHVALMGDPSLRIHYIKSTENLSHEVDSKLNQINLQWDYVEGVDGYFIWRKDLNSDTSKYILLNQEILTQHRFVDENPIEGDSKYIVRSQKIQSGPTGSFEILGRITTDSLMNYKKGTGTQGYSNAPTPRLYPNPNTGKFNVNFQQYLGPADLTVYDHQGRKIYDEQLKSNNQVIQLTDLSPGIYIAIVEQNQQKSYHKLIIQ